MKSWLIHPIEAKKALSCQKKKKKQNRNQNLKISSVKQQQNNSSRNKIPSFEGRACCCLIMKYHYRDQSLDIRHYFMKLLPNHVKMNLFGISKQRKMNE